MKTSTRKTKTSSAPNQIQDEYFTPQKVKISNHQEATNTSGKASKDKDESNVEQKITVKLANKKNSVLKEIKEDFRSMETPSSVCSDSEHKIYDQTDEDSNKQIIHKVKHVEIKELFDSKYTPREFLFREREKNDMFNFIFKCIKTNKYDSILISGNPGIGKTMTITHVLKKLQGLGFHGFEGYIKPEEMDKVENPPTRIETFEYNAMKYKNASDLIFDLMSDLNCGSSDKMSKTSTTARMLIDKLKQGVLEGNKNTLKIVFIDEIDNLFNKQSTAGEMLELLKLPKFPESNLILIGASNTIDLIVNLNKEYKISAEIKNIVFQPYSHEEIFTILKERLFNTEGLEDKDKIFEEISVKFCAKKIYALKGGDIRYVFQVIRGAYEKSKKELANNEDSLTEIQKITLQDMLKVFEELYGKNIDSLLCSMPQQQQIGLLALYMILNKKNSMLITKGDFLKTYNNICNANFLPRIDLSVLEDVLETYESYEFIRLKTKKKVNAMPGRSASKTPMKNMNDEIIPIITADQIKSSLEKSDFFSSYVLEE